MINTPMSWRPPPRLRAAIENRAERDGCGLSEAVNQLVIDGLALDTIKSERDRLRQELDSTRDRLDGLTDVLRKVALEQLSKASGRHAMSELLTRPEVEELTSLSVSSIYRLMAASEFPRPIRIGQRAVRWRAADLSRWLDQRPNGGPETRKAALE